MYKLGLKELIWIFRNGCFDFSKRATRVYFSSEDILVSVAAVISISSGSPPPVLLTFHFATLRDHCACSFVHALSSWRSYEVCHVLFSLEKRGVASWFSPVSSRLRNGASRIMINSSSALPGSLPSHLLTALSRTLPFPTKSLVISVHSPFPVITLSSRATSRIVVSSQHTSATSSQNRLPRSIHFLINKDMFAFF